MNKSGLFTFEAIFAVFVFLTVAFTVYSTWQYINCNSSTTSLHPKAFQDMVERLRSDAGIAAGIEIRGNGQAISFIGENGKIDYEISDGILRRTDITGNSISILNHVKTALFYCYPETQNFFSLYLVSNDPDSFPFFSSFALRGGGQ